MSVSFFDYALARAYFSISDRFNWFTSRHSDFWVLEESDPHASNRTDQSVAWEFIPFAALWAGEEGLTQLTLGGFITVQLGGVIWLGRRTRNPGFDSRPCHCRATTLGKLVRLSYHQE